MTAKRRIEPSDILSLDAYTTERPAYRARMMAHKKDRRLAVGPNATLHFESFETMLYQVQEMLHTERGGDEQLADELAAYQPLIPQGNELVATLMLEYENPTKRAEMLARLGGIEETLTLEFDGEIVNASWERDVDRTTPDGKTSSIHFLHFHMTPEQAAKFAAGGAKVTVAVGHPAYPHMTVMSEATRKALTASL